MNPTTLGVLEALPDEMIVEILSKLTVPQLMAVFNTSASLNQRFRPHFEEAIQQAYQEYQNYLMPPVSMEALMIAINKEIEAVSNHLMQVAGFPMGFTKVCLLSPEMTRAMNLDNFYKVGDRAVYTQGMALEWWAIYIRNNNLKQGWMIVPDELMNSLMLPNLQPAQPFYTSRMFAFIRQHVNCDVPIIITPEISTALYRELEELRSFNKRR
jgi:hypothetical protein